MSEYQLSHVYFNPSSPIVINQTGGTEFIIARTYRATARGRRETGLHRILE